MSQTASLQVVQASFPLEVNGVANIKKQDKYKKTINPLEVNANIKKINQDKYKKSFASLISARSQGGSKYKKHDKYKKQSRQI